MMSDTSMFDAQLTEMLTQKNLDAESFKAHFPLVHAQVVAWGDMDAFAHLNNAIYYRYIESARIAYVDALGLFSHAVTPVIVTNSCHYRVSVEFPDTLLIGAYASRLGSSSMTMSYVLYSMAKKQVVATADAVAVLMNKQMTGTVAIPDVLREKMIAQEAQYGRDLG